jgi:hypothetical protein
MTDQELIDFTSLFRLGVLAGRPPIMNCFIVCAPLYCLLGCFGVACEMVETDLGWINHYWLRLADGRALDPTADQFNVLDGAKMPPVYLGVPTKYHREQTEWQRWHQIHGSK